MMSNLHSHEDVNPQEEEAKNIIIMDSPTILKKGIMIV